MFAFFLRVSLYLRLTSPFSQLSRRPLSCRRSRQAPRALLLARLRPRFPPRPRTRPPLPIPSRSRARPRLLRRLPSSHQRLPHLRSRILRRSNRQVLPQSSRRLRSSPCERADEDPRSSKVLVVPTGLAAQKTRHADREPCSLPYPRTRDAVCNSACAAQG